MATVPAKTRTRKPVSRTVRVLEQPTHDTDGWGALQITVNGKPANYLVRFIPCEFGAGVLGLELEKLDDELTTAAEKYHVALDPFAGVHQCECLGFLRHHRCKHTAGLAKLVELGALKPPAATTHRSAGDYAANDPCGWEDHSADVA
jgi:hypothetical protein